MVTLYQFAITIGILCAYFSNAVLVEYGQMFSGPESNGFVRWIFAEEVWRGMFGTETIPAALFFICLLFGPESPRWLVKEGLTDKGGAVLARLLGPKEASRELREITATIAHENPSLSQLLKPGLRTALIIGILLPAFSQFSGINVIIYYGPEIFNKAGFTLSHALGGQVTIGIVNVLFTLVAIWKIDRMGRRPLLMIGISGVFTALVLVGLFFYNNVTAGFMLLAFFLMFIACFAFSFGPGTWVVISEIFPTSIRGRAMSIATFSLWMANVIVGQMFPWLLENIGAAGTFWLFAVLCIPALYLVWKVIPETKGKTLEEIERHWETLAAE
jgi:SP family arabinose:H+ symporter-like MFS transporter